MRRFVLFPLACLAAVAILATVPTLNTPAAAQGKGKGGGGSNPPAPQTTPLIVTVNETQTYAPSGPGTVQSNVRSDGGGNYTDGAQGVCAALDTYGNLEVDLQCKSFSTPRALHLFGVLPQPLAPPTGGSYSCTLQPLTTIPHLNHFRASPASDLAAPAFQNMTVDVSGNTVYRVQFLIATKLLNDPTATAWRVNYHGIQTFSDGVKSSYAEVRRVSATQWIVEPVAPSALPGNPVNAGMVVHETSPKKNKTTITQCGFYEVPFSFTLTAK